VAGVVDTGVGTGAGDVQPAARIPTNRTAQTKNGIDFIFTEYHHLLFIHILIFSFRASTWIISSEITILTVNQGKKGSGTVTIFNGFRNIPEVLSYSVKFSKVYIVS